jgi:hypothetical protein
MMPGNRRSKGTYGANSSGGVFSPEDEGTTERDARRGRFSFWLAPPENLMGRRLSKWNI